MRTPWATRHKEGVEEDRQTDVERGGEGRGRKGEGKIEGKGGRRGMFLSGMSPCPGLSWSQIPPPLQCFLLQSALLLF